MRLKTEQRLGRMDGGGVGEVLGVSSRINEKLYRYNNNCEDVEVQLKTNLREGRRELYCCSWLPQIRFRLSSVAHGRKSWRVGLCTNASFCKPTSTVGLD